MKGFIAKEGKNNVHGRPVGVAFTKEGNLLVPDDSANTVWFVKENR